MKTASTWVTWLIFLTLLAGCIAVQFIPNDSLQSRANNIVIILKSLAWPVMVIIICWTPTWILLSDWRVKKAIEKAQEPDYDAIRYWLRPTAAPLYPSPRYNDIVLLLKQLYTTPSAKPDMKASRFSQYFTTRGQGYFLTLEGKLKMLNCINSGFLSTKYLGDFEPKDILKIVRNLIVVVVLIRFGIFIIGTAANWFAGH